MSRQSSKESLGREGAADLADVAVVRATEANIVLTPQAHADRTVVLNLASTDGQTVTLPKATGSGDTYRIRNNVVQTQVITIAALGTDVFSGTARMVHTTAVATSAEAFQTTASSDKCVWDGTDGTSGGKRGDEFEAVDIAAGTWLVKVVCFTTGSVDTPFSET